MISRWTGNREDVLEGGPLAGLLIAIQYPTYKETYQYDQNKVTYGKMDNTGSVSFTVGQSYNADHSYPDGSAGQSSYDKGRVSLVTLPDPSQIRYGNYQWLTATRIETPRATKTISVDALQRPLSIEVKNAAAELLVRRHYQYDKAGNITKIDSDLGRTEYGYDNLDRLTKAAPDQPLKDLGLPTEQYQYDAVHNRVFSGHQVGQWSYNADNQLTSYPRLRPFDKAAQPIQTQVEYTPQGHTARESSDKGERTYNYNAAERLIRYSSAEASQSTPGIDAQYRYDPLGRRIFKEVREGQNYKITYFFYSDSGLLGEASEQGQMTRAYAFNPQKSEQGLWSTDPIWQADVSEAQLTSQSTSVHYLHTDHLGTPVLGTSKKGAVIWNGVADAFGATGALPQSQVEMNLRFPGQYFDMESGLVNNLNRDYSNFTARYMQLDPIKLIGGINFYIYSKNNPIIFFDDRGLKSKSCPLILRLLGKCDDADGYDSCANDAVDEGGNCTTCYTCCALNEKTLIGLSECKLHCMRIVNPGGGTCPEDKVSCGNKHEKNT